jgi:nitrile hydratase beta subunit
MNGIHDMGGMDGFGAVRPERNEPVFHHEWEKRVFVIANSVIRMLRGNVDEFRHAIERIPPARYLDSTYYERWLQAAETLLLEHGLVSREELASLAEPERAAVHVPAAGLPARVARNPRPRAKFRPGDRVRVRNINPTGHTRSPRYARGKSGVVRGDHGVYVFPDTNAHHAGENRQHVYSVEFSARELWGKPARERVLIDLWEDYLEPAEAKPARPKRSTARAAKPARRKR